MNINVYTGFSKKKNSTKVPTGTGTAVTSSLKRQTSYHNPVFVLSPITGVSMEDICYVKYGSHYYFVTDITVVPNNVYEISCAEDPMATHRSEILGSSQYVAYSASQNNPLIADSRIVVDDTEMHTAGTGANDGLDTEGCFILSCLNYKHGNYLTATYVMDDTNLVTLAKFLLNDSAWTATNFEAWFRNTLGNAYDSIISLRWVPVKYSDISATEYVVALGTTDITWTDNDGTHTCKGKIVPQGVSAVLSKLYTINHTWHYKDDWRIANPYTRAKLLLPGYGLVDINPVEHLTGTSVRYAIDMLSGGCTIFVYGNNLQQVASINFNISTDIPIAQLSGRGIGSVTTIAAGLGALLANTATGGTAGAVFSASGLAAAVKGASDLFTTTPSAKGNMGDRSWVGYSQPGIIEYYMDTQDLNEFNTTNGMPLMEEVTLSTLSGYCQCVNASVSIAGYDDDRNYINNILNTGFFIE